MHKDNGEYLKYFYDTLDECCESILKHFCLIDVVSSQDISDMKHEIKYTIDTCINYTGNRSMFNPNYNFPMDDESSHILTSLNRGFRKKQLGIGFNRSVGYALRDNIMEFLEELYNNYYHDKKVKVHSYNSGYIYVDLYKVSHDLVEKADNLYLVDDNIEDILYEYSSSKYVETNKTKTVYEVFSIGGDEVAAYLSENKCDDWMYYACYFNGSFRIQCGLQSNKCNTLYNYLESIVNKFNKLNMLITLGDNTEPSPIDVCKAIVEHTSIVNCSKSANIEDRVKALGIPLYITDVMVHYTNGYSLEEAIAISYMEAMYFLTNECEILAKRFNINPADRYKHLSGYLELAHSGSNVFRNTHHSIHMTKFSDMLVYYIQGKYAGNKITKEEISKIAAIIREMLDEQ